MGEKNIMATKGWEQEKPTLKVMRAFAQCESTRFSFMLASRTFTISKVALLVFAVYLIPDLCGAGR